MLLNDIVEISRRVGEVSGRVAKIELLAGCLRRAVADEIDIAAPWLSGELRQGRIGIGYAARGHGGNGRARTVVGYPGCRRRTRARIQTAWLGICRRTAAPAARTVRPRDARRAGIPSPPGPGRI